MRMILLPLLFLPLPAVADTIEAVARPDRVTVYPEGANVERLVTFTAPVGAHSVIIQGLPEGLEVNTLRVTAPEGVRLDSMVLSTDRQPVTADAEPDAVKAAEEEVDRLAEVLAKRDDEIAAKELTQRAADAQIGYLNRLGVGQTEAPSPDAARALIAMIGEEVSAASQRAIAARADIRAAQKLREDDQRALERAEQHLAAIRHPEVAGNVLTLSLETAAAGETALTLTTFTENAGWGPAYDMYLTRAADPALEVDRSVVVAQYSGEDWRDVDLTLSTARPGQLRELFLGFPSLVGIESEEARAKREAAMGLTEGELGGMAEPVMEPEVVFEKSVSFPTMSEVGDTVSYHYPERVTLRDGADQVQLALDSLSFEAEVFARASRHEDTAFLVASVTNAGTEIFLPGSANLYVDGAFRGRSAVPQITPGDKAEIGFGAIDGIRVKRIVQERSEGDRGMIAKSNQRYEVTATEIRNLTGEDWPVTVVDHVPYSEQDDLTVTYAATPPVTTADADGERGRLEWEMTLGAGQTQTIRLETSLKWPDGWVLK